MRSDTLRLRNDRLSDILSARLSLPQNTNSEACVVQAGGCREGKGKEQWQAGVAEGECLPPGLSKT